MVFSGISLPLDSDLQVLSILDRDAHASSRSGDHAHRRLDVRSIQIWHLQLSDLADLLLGDGSNLLLVRGPGCALQIAGLLQKYRCRRSLRMKLKLLSA